MNGAEIKRKWAPRNKYSKKIYKTCLTWYLNMSISCRNSSIILWTFSINTKLLLCRNNRLIMTKHFFIWTFPKIIVILLKRCRVYILGVAVDKSLHTMVAYLKEGRETNHYCLCTQRISECTWHDDDNKLLKLHQVHIKIN